MATVLRRRPTGLSEPPSVSGTTQRQATAAPRRSLFRPRSRSRVRLLAGVTLLAAAVVVNLAVYRRLDERVPVLQVTRDVPAGEQIVESDIREVEASTSSDINVVSAAELTSIVGQTAIVRLVAGSLLVHQALSTRPLVAAGSSIVALTFPTGGLPAGLRERSQVLLVMIAAQGVATPASSVSARVVTLPAPVSGQTDRLGLSFEVSATDAPHVVAAETVRVILVDPGSDPAYSTTQRPPSPISTGRPTASSASVPPSTSASGALADGETG